MLGGASSADIGTFIEALRHCSVRELSDHALAEQCLASTVLVNVVLGHAAALAAEFEQRASWSADGATSGAAWLANRTGERRSELTARARVGATLRRFPDVAEALAAGEIGFDHARRLTDCARQHPELAARDEAVLLEQARALDADAFRLVVRHWASIADDAADAPAEDTAPRRSSLHLSMLADGWHAIDGLLSPEHGESLRAVLDESVDRQLRAQRDGDPSLERLPLSAMRAEALADIVAQHQRRPPSDCSAPDRYRVGVVLRPDDLVDPPLSLCDSFIYRAVVDANGEVLDIGRVSRDWTPPIRRAVTLRDGGCVFPGCDRPPSWSDVHHCHGWGAGGPTSVDNGCLLCRRHHSFIHAKRWQVRLEPGGRPQVHRPDGTLYTIDRWQLTLPSRT